MLCLGLFSFIFYPLRYIFLHVLQLVEEKERPLFMQESSGLEDISPGLPRSESTPIIQNGGNSYNMVSKEKIFILLVLFATK